MNRGKVCLSFETLKEYIKLPDDFKMSGLIYNWETNSIEVYGYSIIFKDVVEGANPDED